MWATNYCYFIVSGPPWNGLCFSTVLLLDNVYISTWQTTVQNFKSLTLKPTWVGLQNLIALPSAIREIWIGSSKFKMGHVT